MGIMGLTFGELYVYILLADVIGSTVLLFGGRWYHMKLTVRCPECGIRYPKYRVGMHECPGRLVGTGDDHDHNLPQAPRQDRTAWRNFGHR